MNVGGREEVVRALAMSVERRLVVCRDSLPPFRIAALPAPSQLDVERCEGRRTGFDGESSDVDHHLGSRLEDDE